jgi:hypothetical protein
VTPRRGPKYGEQERLQRITSAMTSSAQQLGQSINAIEQHIARVAGTHHVKRLDVLDELYRREESR